MPDYQQGSGLYALVLVKPGDMPKDLGEDGVRLERQCVQVELVSVLSLVLEEVSMNREASQAQASSC